MYLFILLLNIMTICATPTIPQTEMRRVIAPHEPVMQLMRRRSIDPACESKWQLCTTVMNAYHPYIGKCKTKRVQVALHLDVMDSLTLALS
jgi:hypothetical protein